MKTCELIKALRTSKSRSKRALLDEAADTIEALLKELKKAADCDPCGICWFGSEICALEGECSDCDSQDCRCRACLQEQDAWEWRGPQKGVKL